MKLNLFFIIPSLAILASAATSDDTEGGWNNAHWGMTAQQIRETYPSSQMLSTPETYQSHGSDKQFGCCSNSERLSHHREGQECI